ncbi:3-phosphoshikimate 1-carboxyvinyltransferase [uncultured Oceanicoccus sp.]|uniref:3-phosphoshikimate 1-carboxyvinyltransferase n=1 Tax=uncultured Oceanicoccus sp. TaxID=1706381 RepID=UPI0030D90C9D
MSSVEQLVLQPIAGVHGEVVIPGSKSLSNRALLLAALAEGETRIHNLLDSDDIRHMLNALEQLGVDYELSVDRSACVVKGMAGPLAHVGSFELFLGNAGTAMRPLTAALCLGAGGEYTLTGEPRMSERPIEHLVDALQPLGASIDYLQTTGYPPLKITGTGLNGGEIEIDGSISSQFLTALLMSAPLASEAITIKVKGELVSKPYIDITLDLMAKFGVVVSNDNYQTFSIAGGQSYRSPGELMVEGDASSASYFLAAAAIAGGTVRVYGVGKNSVQGDIRFAEVLAQMGAKISYAEDYIEASKATLNGIDVDLNHIPDAAMTIATTALFANGPTTIRNVYNWRVKETDRLTAMATELRKVGAEVIEGDDYIEVTPPAKIKSAAIDTYDDHRMAMCFSLAAMGDAAITINDPGCTAKTFPSYFELFGKICV